MGLFRSSSARRVPLGHAFGRELAHHEHQGWRKLLLLRHGQTHYNVQHLLPGQLPGISLNDEGRREAHTTPETLRDRPPTAIVASPLELPVQTAEDTNTGRALPIPPARDPPDTD